jgi:hypothetical protein
MWRIFFEEKLWGGGGPHSRKNLFISTQKLGILTLSEHALIIYDWETEYCRNQMRARMID